jgi:hypothetical protein
MSARARRSISVPCLLLAASALMFAAPKRSAAQVLYGSIVGDVKDPSGASIPGATVVVTNTAFAEVTAARFGNTGYNILRGPGLFNWDFGLTREFSLTESFRVQLRVESFNFTNTPHLATPDNNVGDGADFMTITSVQDLGRKGIDERQFRLGLRIVF